jgi:antitoxin (DNA-binding transcriptional repressor) of toxin-antitoxin stability system
MVMVIQKRITMTASIRDLRDHFPRIRKLVETTGEVLLTEKGKPHYRLTLYAPAGVSEPAPVDYWARLNAYQPKALTKAQSQALHDENRGDRTQPRTCASHRVPLAGRSACRQRD